MVAENRNKPPVPGQLNEHVKDAFRVGSSIHIVTKADERIVCLGGDAPQNRSTGIRAAVNVANGDGARHD